jgi:hypothetical protein
MDFYIFEKNGNYLGMRGSAPTDTEIGIEATPEAVAFMTTAVAPMVVGGKLTETATPEQIAAAQKEAVPNEVALWKLRFVLSQMQLEQSVAEAISLLEEPQRTAATYIWNFGTAVDRDSNTVIFIKTALGLTEQEVDNIFIQANSIQL